MTQQTDLPLSQPSFAMPLARSLSSFETWGFGLSGLLLWLGTAPGMHAKLGAQAMLVWIPGAIIGVMLNLQVKRLGKFWQNVSGGTPNYTTRLLERYPLLASYGAIGYFLGWVSVPTMNAIILTDLIKSSLEPLGIECPVLLIRIVFTCLPFIVAFSGTRALSILHSFFVIPAIGFLLAFCLQGVGWLAFDPSSPSLMPSSWGSFAVGDWSKWFFVAIYAVYGCETASSFVAESRHPQRTVQCLGFAACLLPIVYVGGSWVLMRLATEANFGDSAYLNLTAAAKPFWHGSASMLVTFLIASGCLLSSATAVSNSPRVLYQLACDKYLSPVFAVVSRRGVLAPGLALTFSLSLICLIWGDVGRIVMITGTGYLCAMMSIHLGEWLQRGKREARWSEWSLGFLIIEAFVLVVGGFGWSWQDLLIGMLLPLVIVAGDAIIRRVDLLFCHPAWWIQLDRKRSHSKVSDLMLVQVSILIFLICGSTSIGWAVRTFLDGASASENAGLFIILLMTIAFVGVAIASWTTLPQVAAVVEAREQAEHIFQNALNAVLVLDENGIILQVNPATEEMFGLNQNHLRGQHLNEFLFELADHPEKWSNRSEQALIQPDQSTCIIEVAVSARTNQDQQEYIVILQDITQRKQAEAELYQTVKLKEELALAATGQAQELEKTLQDLQRTQAQLIQTEKMSSLGQLVAGVAHEINNPVNFIFGNLTHVDNYMRDLLALVDLYQQGLPYKDPQVQAYIAEIDFDFLLEDLPKILVSMKVGTDRIRQIVLTLRNFSRLDEAEMKPVDIHEGIDSTLLILQNRLKMRTDRPVIQVIKEYGNLPLVECYAGQLNQVFMNIMANAIDALHERDKHRSLEMTQKNPSTITIATKILNQDAVAIIFNANGLGIPDAVIDRLFDPFFTTKEVGEGTGLGLSISYQIVTEKHGGRLYCLSKPDQGAEFVIEIPTKQM